MNEKIIERKLREAVKSRGGLALKWASPFYTGMPDRIVFMPGGKIFFAEIKSTGKKLSPNQQVRIRELQQLGFDVSVLDDQLPLDNFLKKISG